MKYQLEGTVQNHTYVCVWNWPQNYMLESDQNHISHFLPFIWPLRALHMNKGNKWDMWFRFIWWCLTPLSSKLCSFQLHVYVCFCLFLHCINNADRHKILISMHIYVFVIFVCSSQETDLKKVFACFWILLYNWCCYVYVSQLCQ